MRILRSLRAKNKVSSGQSYVLTVPFYAMDLLYEFESWYLTYEACCYVHAQVKRLCKHRACLAVRQSSDTVVTYFDQPLGGQQADWKLHKVWNIDATQRGSQSGR